MTKVAVAACMAVGIGFAEASTVTNLTVRSEKMGRDIPVSTVLPEGYDAASETRYPSIWILNGSGGSVAKKAAEKVVGQGAEISARFIANYFKDGYGHLGDVDTRPEG